jgi:hypothetical protein
MRLFRRAGPAGPGEQGPAGRAAGGPPAPQKQAPALTAVAAPDEGGRPPAGMTVVLAGLREPIVVILYLIAFFTAISGKPLDGLLLFIVATGLAWDASVRYRGRARATAAGEPAAASGSQAGVSTRRPLRTALAGHGRLLVAAGLAGGAGYAALVGSFSRYSWPATVGVIALGAAVVAAGWRGPLRRRPDPGPLPLPGAALWAGVLVAGGLWELASLFQQPNLTTTSDAHPTISALTDPLLGSHAGRSAALAVWLAVGWFLAGR